MKRIHTAIFCISIIFVSGVVSCAHCADFDSRLASAINVLSQKGYISNARVRHSATYGAIDKSAEKALNRALDSFDMEAANAIGWLNKQGLAVAWSEQMTIKEEKAKASSTLTAEDKWKHILEQVYGKGGQGYLYEEDANQNPNLNKELAEVYRASDVYAEDEGWYSIRVEIGPFGETETTIPLRLNINTGQVIEYPEDADQEATSRQFTPLRAD